MTLIRVALSRFECVNLKLQIAEALGLDASDISTVETAYEGISIFSLDASKVTTLKSIRNISVQLIDQPTALALLEPIDTNTNSSFKCLSNVDAVEQYRYFNQILPLQKETGVKR